jgi:LysM repeat protein
MALFVTLLAVPGGVVRAADPSAQDLIAAVNALRASKGLSAYTFDASLSAYAQAQTDYMAANNTLTHTRPDGSVPWGIGLKENIAYGQTMSPDIAVNQVWTDALHYDPMVLPGGAAGAGVSRSGDNLYFSLVVRPSGTAVSTLPTQNAATQSGLVLAQVQNTLAPTATATIAVGANGAVTHVVVNGDTLTSIAAKYNTTVAELKRLNNIGDNNVIFLGTTLIVRAGNTATPTLAPSATPSPVTPTIEPSPTPKPTTAVPQSTATIAVTSTPAPQGFFGGVPGFFSKNLGGLIVGVLLGLAVGFFVAQFGRRR